MKTDSCLRYIEDPEANAGHLAECEECRALFGETEVPTKPLSLQSLPMAPWEGAAHRAWPVVIGSAVVVLIVAIVLCIAAGLTPMQVADNVRTSMQARRAVVLGWADSIRAASRGMQVAFVAAFFVVNAILIALLRRSPRGIDA